MIFSNTITSWVTQLGGEHLKYVVYGDGRVVACLAWSSAPRHLGPRDRFIGWTAETRRRNIRFIAYNTRFLIPPWIQVPHLASHILGRMPLVVVARLGAATESRRNIMLRISANLRASDLLSGNVH